MDGYDLYEIVQNSLAIIFVFIAIMFISSQYSGTLVEMSVVFLNSMPIVVGATASNIINEHFYSTGYYHKLVKRYFDEGEDK